MSVYQLGLLGAAISLIVIFEMLRRRRLREKYAVFWVILAVLIVIVALFPGVLSWAADITGVRVPANLLFFGGSLVLLAVNVQLSSEVGRLEERVRTLAEEVALQNAVIERLAGEPSGRSGHRPGEGSGARPGGGPGARPSGGSGARPGNGDGGAAR